MHLKREMAAERHRGNQESDTTSAWSALLALSLLVRQGRSPDGSAALAEDGTGSLSKVHPGERGALLVADRQGGWRPAPGLPSDVRDLLDLYLPLCRGDAGSTLTVGHLGQSLDGCIATASGDSCYVTGRENILHLHRMRALCDAIVVGAETVARDDPRLTTRLVEGNNPVRVVLDPRRRLPPDHRVFTDGEARTLVVHAFTGGDAAARRWGGAEAVSVPARGKDDGLELAAVLAELHGRGLRRVFVEGGGVTVSAFLEAGLLDRLQVAIAPVIIGDGRRGIRLPPRESMGDCLRPGVRVFRMGSDILFDCEPKQGGDRTPEGIAGPALLRVI